MYTIPLMPKRENLKGAYKHFQFKIYGEEIKRWNDVAWTAKARAIERQEKISETDINRALLGMADARDWLVTAEERLYFLGVIKQRPTSLHFETSRSETKNLGGELGAIYRHATTPEQEKVKDIETDETTGLPRRRKRS